MSSVSERQADIDAVMEGLSIWTVQPTLPLVSAVAERAAMLMAEHLESDPLGRVPVAELARTCSDQALNFFLSLIEQRDQQVA